MLLFFVTIGAAAGSPRSILGCGWLAMFMIVQLAVHLGIVLGVGRAAGLPMQVSHYPDKISDTATSMSSSNAMLRALSLQCKLVEFLSFSFCPCCKYAR